MGHVLSSRIPKPFKDRPASDAVGTGLCRNRCAAEIFAIMPIFGRQSELDGGSGDGHATGDPALGVVLLVVAQIDGEGCLVDQRRVAQAWSDGIDAALEEAEQRAR